MHLAANPSALLQPQPGRGEASRYVAQTALNEPARTGVLGRDGAPGTKQLVPAGLWNLS